MEWILKKFSSAFQLYIPIVKANESEEEEVQDPQIILRAECEKKECSEMFQKLETCNSKVRSKKKTAETCDEEMIEFINCLDECVAKTIFTKLK